MDFAHFFVEDNLMSAMAYKSFEPLLPVLFTGKSDLSPFDPLVVYLHQVFDRIAHFRVKERLI